MLSISQTASAIVLQALNTVSRSSVAADSDHRGMEGPGKPKDWRKGFQRAPWWVSQVMSNGFKRYVLSLQALLETAWTLSTPVSTSHAA